MCFLQTSYRKRLTTHYLDKYKNHQNLLKSMTMKNGRLSRSWTREYTGRSYNIVSNGLDSMKIECGTLPQTLWVLLTVYTPSMLTILNALDRQRDLKNGYDRGRMEMMMLITTLMMTTPKTEDSLGLRRGVMSQCCRWPPVVCMNCIDCLFWTFLLFALIK